jgi:hypothetical protein
MTDGPFMMTKIGERYKRVEGGLSFDKILAAAFFRAFQKNIILRVVAKG